MKRIAVLVLVCCGVVFTLPAATAATSPPTIGNHEILNGTVRTSLTVNCNPNGTSTLHFDAVGVAVGPYPGTFEASGTITFGAQTIGGGSTANYFNVGPILSYHERFRIVSGTTTINGTKELATPPPNFGTTGGPMNTAFCGEFTDATLSQVLHARGRHAGSIAYLHYDATIDTPTGRFRDTGDSFSQIIEQQVEASSVGAFHVSNFFEWFFGGTVSALNTPGLATGGGQVDLFGAPPLTRISFGFEASYDDVSRFQGTCSVVDEATDTHIRCLDVTQYTQVGTKATFEGHALVNGEPTRYRIDVDDLDESGIGRDTFKIVTTSGYSAAGVLTSGNVQVHPQKAE